MNATEFRAHPKFTLEGIAALLQALVVDRHSPKTKWTLKEQSEKLGVPQEVLSQLPHTLRNSQLMVDQKNNRSSVWITGMTAPSHLTTLELAKPVLLVTRTAIFWKGEAVVGSNSRFHVAEADRAAVAAAREQYIATAQQEGGVVVETIAQLAEQYAPAVFARIERTRATVWESEVAFDFASPGYGKNLEKPTVLKRSAKQGPYTLSDKEMYRGVNWGTWGHIRELADFKAFLQAVSASAKDVTPVRKAGVDDFVAGFLKAGPKDNEGLYCVVAAFSANGCVLGKSEVEPAIKALKALDFGESATAAVHAEVLRLLETALAESRHVRVTF